MTDVRIITEPLGGSPLSRLLQAGQAPLAWLPRAPHGAAEWTARVRERSAERGWSARLHALAPAFGATGAAADRLERVRREGGVVVTTGQQPGLFGGPVYTWSKAMGALALADELERVTGVPTVAVFWAATDDADFAEASSSVIAGVGGAELLRAENAPDAGTPMARAPLGDVARLLDRLRTAAGSAADPRALEALLRAYGSPTTTVGDAYLMLLRELLSPLGVLVLDASQSAVHAASEPTLRAALTASATVERALLDRQRELRESGYAPQVDDVPGLSLVFGRTDGVKHRLSIAEAQRMSGGEPVVLTPNVLLRPVVEQHILPTVAYVGGPGEIAYFAQVTAVATALGTPLPLVLPRWSCTLIEPEIDRLLVELKVEISALADPHALERAVAVAAMHGHSAAALDQIRRAITGLSDGIEPEAAPLGLSAAVAGAVQSLHHRVDRLERRVVAGIKRRESGQLREVATLRAALFPLGTRQERALNLIPFLARHGLSLLSEMRDAASAHAKKLVDPT